MFRSDDEMGSKMDKKEIISLLERKSNEAWHVASLPPNNIEFIPWRRNIEDILETVFGVDSTEYKRVHDADVVSQGSAHWDKYGYKELVQKIQLEISSIIQKYQMFELGTDNEAYIDKSRSDSLKAPALRTNWRDIESEFGVTKRSFGKRINFVKDPFKRTVIYRDVEQAFILGRSGFSKPAMILAGGVIEELLRLYLKQKGISPQKPLKKDFNGYIQTCEQKGLLKAGISHLSDSARYFRNLVHLSKEETKRHAISKSTAKGAVASIFTIVNDFEVVPQQLDSLRTKTKDSIVINGKKLKIVRFDPSQGLNLDNLQAVLDLHFHDKLKVQKLALQDLLNELLDNKVSIEEIEDGYHELLDIFPQVETELSECMKPHRPNQVEVVRFILDLTHDAYWSYHETLMPSDLAEIIRKWRAILLGKQT